MAHDGVDQVYVPLDAAVIFEHPVVNQKYGPLYIHSGVNAIKWAYTLNTQSYPTIGGEVTQVLSAFVGPMMIQGQAAGLATNQAKKLSPGVNKGWSSYSPFHELEAIIKWFLYYMEIAGSTTRGNQRRDELAIKFTYPTRGWSFYIQPTALTGFRYDKAVISPEWGIQAEIVSDNALNFFEGVTMSSFTDDLVTNYQLAGQIGLSAFANSGTERNNFAFGQTGGSQSTDPFLNPSLSPGFAQLASDQRDSFQQLLGAFAGGTFADFGFGTLADSNANLPTTDEIAKTWKQLFGSTFIGGNPGTASTGTILQGTTTYNAKPGAGQDADWIDAVLAGLGAPKTAQNIAFMSGWGQAEGGGGIGGPNTAKFNWMNTTLDEPGATTYNSIGVKNYPDFATGIRATVATLQNTLYDDVVEALQSGDPYKNPPLQGLGNWGAGPNASPAARDKYAQSIMAINGTPVAGSAAVGGFTFYSQFNPQWANVPYGSSGTVSSSGCGVSSIAMIATSLTGKPITPDVIAKNFGYEHVSGGSSSDLAPAVAKAYKLKATQVSNLTEAAAAIRGGAYVLAGGQGTNPFTSGGHIIVLRGVTADGNFLLGDPNTSGDPTKPQTAPNNTTAYPPSTLQGKILYMWAVS